ncbi:MAG: hypothetical protein EBX70_12525 [Betaproteobacteria bacterium]|nr:hypothetical protein [Betaproteobacteria bacterium]
MSQNWWVDNRRDPVHSTQAALDYLQRIYELQGNDWFLALASYNWGEGAVGRAMRRNQSSGKPFDYLSLNMPNETRHYVPKLMALREIVANPQAYNLRLPLLPNKPYFVEVEAPLHLDLKLAARFAGALSFEASFFASAFCLGVTSSVAITRATPDSLVNTVWALAGRTRIRIPCLTSCFRLFQVCRLVTLTP